MTKTRVPTTATVSDANGDDDDANDDDANAGTQMSRANRPMFPARC